jgi:predicted ArsR family transcriptional regulator
LCDAGKGLAEGLPSLKRSTGSLGDRVNAASKLLNEHLGASTAAERNGGYLIRGTGCPLSALTGKHPAVCLALESLVTEIVGAPVHQCCDRALRPRCCFEVKS